tara:strand:- start:336 stop:464 length:129 start_codon:yes stop_codon:yes gene_type:complete
VFGPVMLLEAISVLPFLEQYDLARVGDSLIILIAYAAMLLSA